MIDSKELSDSVAKFCMKEANLKRTRDVVNSDRDFDPVMWQTMADMGWTCLLVPEELGGLGLGVNAMMSVAEEVGRYAIPEPLLEVAVASTVLLSEVDVSAQSSSLLEGLIGGETIPISCLAAEVSMKRTDDGAITLNGQVTNVPLINSANGFLVCSSDTESKALVWIPASAQGLTLESSPQIDGTTAGSLLLENVKPGTEAILLEGDAVVRALEIANEAVSAVSSAYLFGLQSHLLEITLEYLKTRKQFGRAIGSFQALQHRCVDLYVQNQLTQATVKDVTSKVADAASLLENKVIIAKCRHRAVRATMQIVKEAIQLHGAIGFTSECDVSLFVNRGIRICAAYGNGKYQASRFAYLSKNNENSASEEGRTQVVADPDNKNWNSLSDEDFRALVRQFFEKEYPEDKRHLSKKVQWEEIKDWYKKIYEKGWVAPAWPSEYGGMGLDPSKLIIFNDEQERYGIARTPGELGVLLVGPVLIKHGSSALQEKFLPKILDGEHVWCQGYSEPNAGSDLASLKTTAEIDGEDFVINGQKTWTTRATESNWMFILALTDKEVIPQRGISFILMDFSSPGITVRPIENLAGHAEFAEVFLDDVRVPRENLVGELNQGWTIAKSLLTFERLFSGSPQQSRLALNRLGTFANEKQLTSDPVFSAKYNEFRMDVLDLETLYSRFADQVRRGEALGPEIAMLKIWGTATCQKISEYLVELAGVDGSTLGHVGKTNVDVMSQYYYSRPITIFGGTSEIQRNILSKHILELPTK